MKKMLLFLMFISVYGYCVQMEDIGQYLTFSSGTAIEANYVNIGNSTQTKSGGLNIGGKLNANGNVETTAQFISSGAGTNYFAGNVGIGFEVSTCKLKVKNMDNSSNDIFQVYANNETLGIGINYAGISQITAGQSINLNACTSGIVNIGGASTGGVLLANGGGNVGIGTTNPSAKLSVSTTSTSGFGLNFIGGVDALPTTGYNRWTFCGLTTDNQIYISTETVVGTQSWKSW